ncbi:MAG: hypothetical protein ACI8ZB_003859 [Desulforhopalus sp.]|jgi:hypothetical protein
MSSFFLAKKRNSLSPHDNNIPYAFRPSTQHLSSVKHHNTFTVHYKVYCQIGNDLISSQPYSLKFIQRPQKQYPATYCKP